MNLVENSKQFEYLMAIKNVGMQIVFRKANGLIVLDEFARFGEYIEDNQERLEFIKSLEHIYDGVNAGVVTPDDLLFELGQYTPYIVYDDEQEDKEQTSLYDEDDWLYK